MGKRREQAVAKNEVSAIGSDFSDHMTENLQDPRTAAAYLMVSLEDGDVDYFKEALGNVARAYGIATVAKVTNIPRPTLYNILQKESNPSLSTIFEVLKACGLEIAVIPKEKTGLELIGTTSLPRSEVVKKIWDYIRKNNLTRDVLEAGQKEIDQMARTAHRLVRQAKALPHASTKRPKKRV